MYSKCWQIIKDDAEMTFEVCGQSDNGNSFHNQIHGMQKAGMNVSCVLPPVNNKNSSKSALKIFGYKAEVGLHQRLLKKYAELTRGSDWE